MAKNSILVADSGETSRKIICNLLYQRGYIIYQSTDGAGTIRIARKILPKLVLIDTNIWGMGVYELAKIIEEDGLSTVVFVTNNPNEQFYKELKKRHIMSYITKPINSSYLYQIIEFSIFNADKINLLEKKVKKLEGTLETRKKVDKAKGFIMKYLNLSEDEAYQLLRKQSMDLCKGIDKIAEEIIEKYS